MPGVESETRAGGKDKMNEYTTVPDELAKLKDGETLVLLTKADPDEYWLLVGDKAAANSWTLTRAELEQIVRLGAEHLGWEVKA